MKHSWRQASLFFVFCCAAAGASAQNVEKLNVDGLGRLPAFSHAAVAGDLIFVSGTLGTKEGGFELAEGVAAQTEQTLKNIEKILAGAGATLRDVAKVNVFLTDMTKFAEMNEVYLKFFGGSPPARTTAGVKELALGALVEIECVARKPKAVAALKPGLRRTFGEFDAAGERIYYESIGEGEAVVFCHGLGGNHAVWHQQVPAFAAGHRVVTWDQRGFGRSGNAKGEASLARAAEDLAALLDHLQIERAHVVGQSMGGWAALGFALAHPERTLSLALADTIAGIFNAEIEQAFDAMQAREAARMAKGFDLGAHPALGTDLARLDPARAVLYEEISSLSPPPPAALRAQFRSTRFEAEKLKTLRVPVLFVVGAEDRLFPPDVIRAAAEHIPGARVAVIPDAGHSPYFETPEAWNRIVLGFVSNAGSRAQ